MAGAQGFGFFQRRQGIGGFTGLGNGHYQRARLQYRPAIAVFTGHFHLAWHAGQLFKPVAGDQTCVVTGAAGQNQNPPGGIEHFTGVVTESRFIQPLVNESAFQGFRYRPGLLVNFLEHVMLVRAFFHRVGFQQTFLDRSHHQLAPAVEHADAGQAQLRDIAFFQKNKPLGHRQQGGDIGGDKVLFDTDADHQRTAFATDHQPIRRFRINHRQSISAFETAQGLLHRRQQIEPGLQMIKNQIDHDFGIGFGIETVAGSGQLGPKLFVIFDNAVMHHRDPFPAHMGMRVVFTGLAVSRPTGMGNAEQSGDRRLLDQTGQLFNFADRTLTVNALLVDNG